MFFVADQIQNLSEQSLLEFLDRGLREGTHLEYKSQLPGGAKVDNQRFEVLKRVTAFANAQGGTLLVGVDEPDGTTPATTLIQGVQNGEAWASDFENVAVSSIEPRLGGLLVTSVALASGDHAVVIHVPPSFGRPHMVNHRGKRVFYTRHNEKTHPMSAFEIRETVLSSASAESRARKALGAWAERVGERLAKSTNPILLVAAAPLVPPVPLMDVLKRDVRDSFYSVFGHSPQPCLDGVELPLSDADPFFSEFHRDGFLGFGKTALGPIEDSGTSVWGGDCISIHDALSLFDELVAAARFDSPYVVQVAVENANGLILRTTRGGNHSAWTGERLQLTDRLLDAGQPFQTVALPFARQLFNAFGVELELVQSDLVDRLAPEIEA